MRRLIFGALLALAALTALPTTANAALKWRSCVDFNGVQCATLDVPLDRANTMPGTVPLRIARAGRQVRADADVPVRAVPAARA